MMVEKLNRRHKAGLFCTLLVTAACLLSGEPWKESAGVALVALALTWMIGGLKPIHLYWITVFSGLLLATGSLSYRYYDEMGAYRAWRTKYDLLPDTAKYVA